MPTNKSVGIEITYRPTVAVTVADTLYIHTNNPLIGRGIIELSGTGYNSKIEIGYILKFFNTAVAAGLFKEMRVKSHPPTFLTTNQV